MNRELTLPRDDGSVVELSLAGLASRFVAWLVDCVCSIALGIGLGQLVGLLIVFGADTVLAARILGYFLSNIAYGIGSEWLMAGQSVGKRLLGLRVVDASGGQLLFSQVALRNLLRFLDMLPAAYGVGALSIMVSPRAQRLGDLVANTAVVQLRKQPLPSTALLDASPRSARTPAELALTRRLQRALDDAFTLILVDALRRHDELEPSARAELYAELGKAVRTRVQLPETWLHTRSDELMLRNVAEALCADPRP